MPDSSIVLNLEGKTRDELLDLKRQLEENISSIKSQIQQAQATARRTKRYADDEWWLKAHRALRIKGLQCQQIQQALGFLSRKTKDDQARRTEARFLEVARKHLSPEQFRAFLEEAKGG